MSSRADAEPAGRGPPPLEPFGLQLHHDGRWSHEGAPISNRKLREAFDRGVRYLPEEDKYVVRLGHFRAQIVLEEAGFFVHEVELASGEVVLSDRSRDPLDLEGLSLSPIDGALLCRVKRELDPGGLLARFTHAAQAELLGALEERDGVPVLPLAGEWVAFPEL